MATLLHLIFLSILTQAYYLEEFLATKGDIFELACNDKPYHISLIQEELCSNSSLNPNQVIYCTRYDLKSQFIVFMLRLKLKNFSYTEAFRCTLGSNQDFPKVPYLNNLIYLNSQDSIYTVLGKRRLLQSCNATLKFNLVGTYTYKANLAILDSCDLNSPVCGLNVNNYQYQSIPFTLSDGGTVIAVTFPAENINSKKYAVIISASGARIEFYQNNASSGLPSHIKYQTTSYGSLIPNVDFRQYSSSMKFSGIIKSPLNGDVQIGFCADDSGTMNLYGSLNDSINSRQRNVYKSYNLTLGQEIAFSTWVSNRDHGIKNKILFKGSDGVDQMSLNDTYYFGMTLFSPWIFENYYPKITIPTYETLTFNSVTYNNCNQIYKELNDKRISWPQLCSSVYITDASITCLECVSGSSFDGNSCLCNEEAGYYTNLENNSCFIAIPISVKLYNWELSSVSPVMLVISDSCTISDTFECIKDSTRTYLDKTKHILFQNILGCMEVNDNINPEGDYTIFLNTLNSGGLNIKCYSNQSLSGSPLYEAVDFIGVYDFNSIELYNQPSSCIIYGYYKIDIAGTYTFYIQGYNEVSTFIDDSNITASGLETQYTVTFTEPVYIPIRILVRNSTSRASVNVQISKLGSERNYLDEQCAYSTKMIFDKTWDINTSNINLYRRDNKIEMNIILCNALCISCEINLEGTSSCLKCIENASAVGIDCICNDYYEYSSDFNLCIKPSNLCPGNCYECINNTTCIACKERFYLDSNSNTCRSCPNHCITCDHNECIDCDQGFILKDFECICEYGHIYSDNQSSCITLPEFCTNYDIYTGRCLECLDTFELENDMCICREGYYKDEYFLIQDEMVACLACPELCKECLDTYECLTCVEYAELKDSECECNKGFRKENGDCIEDLFIVDIQPVQDRSILLSFNKELSTNLTTDLISIRANSTLYPLSYYNITQKVENKSYMLILSDTLPEGSMNLTILFSEKISSVDGYTLSDLFFSIQIKLKSIQEGSSSLKERGKIIQSVSSVSSYSTLISITVSGVLSMNPNLIISYINTIKIMYYIKYMNIHIPFEVRAEQDISNEMIESMNILTHFNLDRYISYYSENTYSFIAISFSRVIILLLIIILDISLYILNRIARGKLKDKLVKVRQSFRYTIYIQYLFINYLDLNHIALSRLEHVIFIQPSQANIFIIQEYIVALLMTVNII
jgi:hypothetical protein